MPDRIPIEELSKAQLGTKSIDTTWTPEVGADDSWRFWEAFEYEVNDRTFILVANDSGVVAVYIDGEKIDVDDLPDELAELAEVEPYQWGAEGPMMNYRYPLGDEETGIGGYHHRCDAVEAAYRLRDLPLCVVEYDEDICLALTGGGMDLTWEIAEAFTRLGYLPPVNFTALPGMAGRGENDRDRYLIAAAEASLTAAVERAQYQLERHQREWRDGHP